MLLCRPSHALALVAVLALWPLASARAQQAYVPVEQRLTPEQMRATGLDGLSSEQLALLNRLLREDRDAAVVAAKVETEAVVESRTERERDAVRKAPVEARINGRFAGWGPGTRFELDNGQVWQVTEGSLYTDGVDAPRVVITPGMIGGWYLRVDGQTPRAKVKRVK